MSTFTTKVASAVSIVALTATTLGASVTSAASEFLPYAETLAAKSVINSTTEAGYRLNDSITRAELAKVAANLGGYTSAACDSNLFTDVNSSLGDLCDGITTLANAGVVSTSFSKFRPNDKVTRAEMTKIILGALGETGSNTSAGYSDVTASLGDLAGFINRANELKCARSATYFRPNASSSRGETFKIASCAAKLPPIDKKDEGKGKEKPAVTANGLNVTLEGNAIAQYVPMNASNVKVGTIKLTATDGDVKVKTITVNRSGLGASKGMEISLGQNGNTVSENRSVNSSTQDAIVRLNNTLVLKKGESVTLDVLVSVSGTSNSQSQFTVKAVGTEKADATVSGLPVTLGLINTTSYEVSTVKVNSLIGQNVTSGKDNQVIARVKLQAGKRAVVFNGFTLSKESGIDMTRAFADVKVYNKGTEVGTATVTSEDIVVTGLENAVDRNNTVEYELRGNIIYVGDGDSDDDVKLKISESSDVAAIEKDTGYTTEVTTLDKVAKVDLSKLDITWTKNVTKSVTVAQGSSDVTFFDSTVKAGTDFDVTKFTLKLTPAYTKANLEVNFNSLTLTVDGTDYELLDQTQDSAGTYVFSKTSDKFRMDENTPVAITLKGNLSNNATAGDYQAQITINTVKNISNGNTVTVDKASGNSSKVTVKAASIELKASSKSAPDSDKVYSDATDLEIGRFGLEAEAEKVTVQEITLTNAGTLADFTKLISGQNVKIVNIDDGSEVSASVEVLADKVKFTGMSLTVEKDKTSNYKVVVDTNGDLITEMGTQTVNLTVAVKSAYSDSTASITAPATYTTNKTYTAALIPPKLKVTKKADSDNVFVVNIENQSSDEDITIKSIKAQVKPDAKDDNYAAKICFRNSGSSDTCTDAGILSTVVGQVPGAASVFTFDTPIAVSSNSDVEKEIYVDSNFNNPTSLTAEVLAVTYDVNGTEYTETYNVKSK
ncbi:S-layer homology domain-containing protein [Candidatus Gracilibacteria bacterium]|nr:S-layer homology domain-containing protein [Candidatus Gracilibacteria bacterium]